VRRVNVVLRYDPSTIEALRAFLRQGGFEIETRPNALLFARRPSVALHAYASGKILLTGPQAAEYAGVLTGRKLAAPEGDASAIGVDAAPAPAPLPSEPGWLMHFDGACMPRNPGGVAAYGYQVLRDGRVVHEGHGLAAPPGPGATNNVAEFTGLLEGLRWLKANGARDVLVRGDSDLVVETMSGKKSLRAPHLLPLRDEARRLLAQIDGRLEWVPRERNAEADRLSRVGYAEAVRAHPEWAR
jgi:ribonuclease HI